jgi:hypothetical protein
LFKAAIKAITQRDKDAPEPQTKRRGEKEGGGPILMRPVARPAGRPAARGRYAMLHAVREVSAQLQGRFSRAARHAARPPSVPRAFYEAAAAGPYHGDTLEMVNHWSGIDASEALEFDSISHQDAQPS